MTNNKEQIIKEFKEDFKDIIKNEDLVDFISAWVSNKLDKATAKAVSDYQTNYEQKHLASAIKLAKKETQEAAEARDTTWGRSLKQKGIGLLVDSWLEENKGKDEYNPTKKRI